MIADILRFNARSRELAGSLGDTLTLGEYLERGNYSRQFVEHYIRADGACHLVGRSVGDARTFRRGSRRFLRPPRLSCRWTTARCGRPSRAVRASTCAHCCGSRNSSCGSRRPSNPSSACRTRCACAAHAVTWRATITCSSPVTRRRPWRCSKRDRRRARGPRCLSVRRQRGSAAHRRERAAAPPARPRRRGNYHLLADRQEPVALTYDMNVLQSLDARCAFWYRSNNRKGHRRAQGAAGRSPTTTPCTPPRAVVAQARHRELNGAHRTYFCGAYWRSGFHEDGVVSAQAALGPFRRGPRPCRAASTPGGLGTGATRRCRNAFRYRLCLLYLDLAEVRRRLEGRWFWSARRFSLARWHREDHLGDPQRSLDAEVRELVQSRTGQRPPGRFACSRRRACWVTGSTR